MKYLVNDGVANLDFELSDLESKIIEACCSYLREKKI